MRRSVTLALALSAALTALTPTPSASAAALPGHVCFWPQPGEMGGGWCYDAGRGGYAELDAAVRRNAKSFSSQVDRNHVRPALPPLGRLSATHGLRR
ncbi:hypothetical protein AQJ23_30985 [Streptomyces antibioticus]|nr:hypothetical protein [Streptomyces antibioticus]KUN21354.1 hypothetical protein AQJ23_30985 [Streptomyces antibioticus]